MSATQTNHMTDDPTPEETHRSKVLASVAALRALADFAEAHADVLPDHVLDQEFAVWGMTSAEEMGRMAIALGGHWAKGTAGEYFYLERDFGGSSKYSRVKVSLNTHRGNVCERVQVGTETKTIPDPDLVAEVPLVEVEEPVYEWQCPESILDIRPDDFTGPIIPGNGEVPF